MIHTPCQITKTILSLVIFCALTGCFGGGEDVPELGQVTGTVTMDGKPIEGADVTFTPPASGKISRGRSSVGTTDAQGKYKLMYNADVSGAIIGDHKVKVSKLDGDDIADDQIPSKYNEDSKLTKTVVEGDNSFDFDLKSK